MYKRLFLIFVFITTTLIQTQLATADFLIANGSATEDAWVMYSTWRSASDGLPAGLRTKGWLKIEPGGIEYLDVPRGNQSLYIRVEEPDGTEIKPLDHTTRNSSSFWMHPTRIFTTVQTATGRLLDSNLNQTSLETAKLYKYTNEGIHIITRRTDCDPVGPSDLPAQQIYDQAIHSVVWIATESGNSISTGSGVLIDKDRKFIVTNQHVIDNADRVYVFFPYRDRNGILRKDLDYYLNNVEWLVDNNYATGEARIIAQNVENDLAIVQLDWLPSTAREIQHDFSHNVEDSMKRGDKVHILGNPGNRLWNWTQGTFLNQQPSCPVGGSELVGCLEMEGDTHGGNSGGPVLNGQGILIGVLSAGTDETLSLAATTRNVQALLDTVKPRHTFRIKNNAGFTFSYYIKWSDDLNWSRSSLDSGRSSYHWWTGDAPPSEYPKIAFDYIVNDKQFTQRTYFLDTSLRYFGDDYRSHITPDDAEKYVFQYDASTSELNLYIDNSGEAPVLSLEQGIQRKETLQKTVLLPNYPNPFNPETWIPFQLAKAGDITLTIYAADGQLIRTLVLGHRSIGTYQSKSSAAYWDGKNEHGESVASGLYFYTLTTGDFTATRKMLILK